MSKLMIVCLAVVMAVGSVFAADTAERERVQVVAEAALMSAYVFRGGVVNDGGVVQPQLTLAQYGFSFNIWGNYDIDHNVAGVHNDFSEIDLTLAYAIPLPTDAVGVDVGFIKYLFPNSAADDTQEAFVAFTVNAVPILIPKMSMFADFGEADGFYTLFELTAPFEISDVFSLEAGASAGYGSTGYNKFYWNDGRGFNDYNVYAGARYELMERLALSASLTYTWLDGVVRSAGTANYQADNLLWGGINLAYEF
ncbi:MAG: MipA/OmpV family protein [Kiritimatiellales bacterium]|nr:MipA/OmpV family protein [Kiritimatiellales bacterium]